MMQLLCIQRIHSIRDSFVNIFVESSLRPPLPDDSRTFHALHEVTLENHIEHDNRRDEQQFARIFDHIRIQAIFELCRRPHRWQHRGQDLNPG